MFELLYELNYQFTFELEGTLEYELSSCVSFKLSNYFVYGNNYSTHRLEGTLQCACTL
jgi:hypothetical protein